MALCVGYAPNVLLSFLRTSITSGMAGGSHKTRPRGTYCPHTNVKGGAAMATAFFRTVILYLLLVAALRLGGKRQIGELEPIELVLTLLISDLASVPMQDFGEPLLNGVVPIVTLIALSTLLSAVSLRCVRFRNLISGEPALVVREGQLQQQVMRRSRLTIDEVLEQLRGQGITDLNDVKYAVLETNGRLSVLPYSRCQPVTAAQLGLDVTEDVSLPAVLISDGRVMADTLRRCGRDERWLARELKRQGVQQPQDVFLLTLDGQGAVRCQRKEAST